MRDDRLNRHGMSYARGPRTHRRPAPAPRWAAHPPTLDDLERIAREQLTTIPEPFRRHIEGVVIRVDEFCDEETEQEVGVESPFDLLGLYRGVALGRKSVADVGGSPDMIFLYRRPILDFWCETGEDLTRIVRHVLVHEIGHHFGFSDDDMHQIENG